MYRDLQGFQVGERERSRPHRGIEDARVTPGRSPGKATPSLRLLPPHVFLAWQRLKMQGKKLHAERTKCSQRLLQKKKSEMQIVLFPLEQRRLLFPPPPLHIPDLSLPPFPLSFLPSSSSKFWDFSALLGFGQKHKKGVFGSDPTVHKGHLFVLGLGAGNLARPESRRLLQGNVSARRSLSPAVRPAARCPLPMREMQGALARARLESLLRPRHKKRAEAQKRSESFLLSGLGKRGRRPRWGLGSLPQSGSAPARLAGSSAGAGFRRSSGNRGPGSGNGRTWQARSRASPCAPEINPRGWRAPPAWAGEGGGGPAAGRRQAGEKESAGRE